MNDSPVHNFLYEHLDKCEALLKELPFTPENVRSRKKWAQNFVDYILFNKPPSYNDRN